MYQTCILPWYYPPEDRSSFTITRNKAVNKSGGDLCMHDKWQRRTVNIANDLKYVLYLLIYVRSYLCLYLSFSLTYVHWLTLVCSRIFLFYSRTRAPDELTGLIEALRTDLRIKSKFSNVARSNFESSIDIVYA